MTIIHNKIQQSLLALACGDSYGANYEYDGLCGHKFDIKKLPNKPKVIGITDDTKMAVILLNHYYQHGRLNIDTLTKSYKKWAIEDGIQDGIGLHTEAVLIKNKTDKDSQGNGALMRVIPFGLQLIEDGYSFDEAVELCFIDSSITHKNKIIYLANKICLDIAVNGLTVLQKEEYQKLLNQLHLGDTAWVIHSLYIVIEALKMECNFVDGLKYIVSPGGDTDTNCAIFGAIYGYQHNINNEIKLERFLDTETIKLIQELK